MKTLEDVIKFIEGNAILKFERYYTLEYIQGRFRVECIVGYNGGLKDAINRCRIHCTRMGYKFVLVKPAIVDLAKKEALKLNYPDFEYVDLDKLEEKVDPVELNKFASTLEKDAKEALKNPALKA